MTADARDPTAVRRPVILDCDPGHDDVFAIWLAAGWPGLDLRAITTVAGNGTLADTTRNARIACTVAGIDGVPVAAGADRPLRRPLRTAGDIHGENALGGPALPAPTVPLDPRPAVTLIADVLAAAQAPVTLVPTGPLTNVAEVVRRRPDLLGRIDRIVWMGGSTGPGNRTPYAEFNAWVDPEAAEIVLRSGVAFTMVGINLTHQALTTPAVIEQVAALGSPVGDFGAELLRFYCARYDLAQGLPHGPLHDPVAVALVADPTLADQPRRRLSVDASDADTAGSTRVGPPSPDGPGAVATVPERLAVDRFWALLLAALAHLGRRR